MAIMYLTTNNIYMISPQMTVFKTGNFQWTDHSDEFTRQRPWLGIIIANNDVRGVNYRVLDVKSFIIYSSEEFL